MQALAPRTASARDTAEAHTSLCAEGKGEEEGLYTSSQSEQIGCLLGPCMSPHLEGVKLLAPDMVGGKPSASVSTLLTAKQHVSPNMLVWNQQQGARKSSPWPSPQATHHPLIRMKQCFTSNLPSSEFSLVTTMQADAAILGLILLL